MQSKVIGYVRVSTNQQDLNRQRVQIAEYCNQNNYMLVDVIADQMSGAIGEREGYIRLLETRKQDADIIVVSELSRLSRENDIIKVLNNVNNLIEKGIDIVFLDNGNISTIKGGTEIDFPTLILLAAKILAAAEERKNIVGRMMSGKASKWANAVNMYYGGRVPFGYKLVSNPNYEVGKQPKTLLVRDEIQAAIVEEIFNAVISGNTFKSIAHNLQQRGIKNSIDEDFSQDTIRVMVHNTIYKGEWHFRGKTLDGDSIVTKEIWDKAQVAVQSNRMTIINRGVNYNPLKGILKCSCGKGMYLCTCNGALSYRCASRKNKYDETICNNGSTLAENVIKAVWNAIISSSTNEEFNSRNNDEIINMDIKITEIDSIIKANENRIATIKNEMQSIGAKIALVDGSLFDLLVSQYRQKEDEIKQIEELIKNAKIEKGKAVDTKQQLASKNAAEFRNNPTDEEMAAIFQKMLNKATLIKDSPKRYYLVIEFKNKAEITYMILTKNNPLVVMLPTSFKYDRERNKMAVEVFDNSGTNKDGSLSFNLQTHLEYYNTLDIESLFPEIIKDNNILPSRKPEFD